MADVAHWERRFIRAYVRPERRERYLLFLKGRKRRAEFIKARSYLRKWSEYRRRKAAGEKVPPPDTDLGLQPLMEVLQKKRTVHFHTHRADDLLTTLRLKKEFGFELVVQHGTEAYKVLDDIAKAKVPVGMSAVGGKPDVACQGLSGPFIARSGHWDFKGPLAPSAHS